MSIARWDPFGDMVSLRDAMNDLLAGSFVRPGMAGNQGNSGNLPLDVCEQGNDFVISASLPGVNPKNIDVSVLGDTVRIRGEFSENESFPRGQGQQGQQSGQSQQGNTQQTHGQSQHTQGQSQQTQGQSQQAQGQQQSQQGQMQRQQGQGQGQQQNQRWLLRERRFGEFERIVRLPSEVNAGQAKADYNNGVLTITLPKAESARERRIPVGAGASGGQGQEIEVETGKGGKQQTQAQQPHGQQQEKPTATVH